MTTPVDTTPPAVGTRPVATSRALTGPAPTIAPRRRIGVRTFDLATQVAVMAIVNRTPDSFYDRGRTFALDAAVAGALRAVEQGADWVDIGGVPFSPDTPPVSVAEELDRVLPVVQAVRATSDVVISVDTYRPEVAARCVAAGADVVNDTSGLREPAMADVVAATGATIVIAHSLAAPHTHHPRPTYGDVVTEVADFLRQRVELARARGVRDEQIVIDPGHDLNKNTDHSLELIRRLPEIAALGYPTLVALSRKDFVGETLGRPRSDRLPGSLAAAALCVLGGARIVRTHDVAATVDAVRMTEAVLGLRRPVEHRHNR
ncbi:dihydropteroate synthase [Georgenia subflava]|uniref:Dihydropteroate synthase n=2 Tax=Georgenia subflava TaxID=1622177 RepID=A0A6N7ECP3_9MICO|nr:dihydropteroate synthase [Georgenia subflava]